MLQCYWVESGSNLHTTHANSSFLTMMTTGKLHQNQPPSQTCSITDEVPDLLIRGFFFSGTPHSEYFFLRLAMSICSKHLTSSNKLSNGLINTQQMAARFNLCAVYVCRAYMSLFGCLFVFSREKEA